MPKEIVVSVNVQDEQFKQFARDFQTLSDQIKGLTDKFKGVQQSVDKTTQQTQALTNTMQTLWQSTRNMGTTIGRITDHFGRWATLIGGIGVMLGTGAGLWGIDRLSNTMMQRRRQMLGLGGDYASTQAALRAGQITSDSPATTLQNIRMGLSGSPEQMKTLMAMGLYDPKKTPEEIYKELIKKLPDFLSKAPKGFELPYAHAFGLQNIIPDEELLRFTGPKGREAAKEEAAQMEKKPAPMSDDAMRKWTELNQAYMNFTENLKSRFGEKLQPIAEALTKVADGMTRLVNIFSRLNVVQTVIDEFAKWADSLGDLLLSQTLKDAMTNFAKFYAETMKVEMFMFGQRFGALYDQISRLTPVIISLFEKVSNWLLGSNPSAPAQAPTSTGGPIGPHGGPQVPKTNAPTAPIGTPEQQQVPNPFTTPQKQGYLGGSGGGGGTRLATWTGAADRASPGANVRGMALNSFGQTFNFTGSGGGRSQGGLDINNWQLNRVATLRVDNTPGSNMYMTAAGMAG